jgi:hypothetical protein
MTIPINREATRTLKTEKQRWKIILKNGCSAIKSLKNYMQL